MRDLNTYKCRIVYSNGVRVCEKSFFCDSKIECESVVNEFIKNVEVKSIMYKTLPPLTLNECLNGHNNIVGAMS